MSQTDLLRNIQEAEEESRATAEVLRRLAKLGVLEGLPHTGLGFYKFKKNNRGKWEPVFVRVARITLDGKVVWEPDIADPAKLLGVLIARYREKNRRVRELAETTSETEPPWYATPDF